MTLPIEAPTAQDVDVLGIDLGTTNSAIARWSPATGAAEMIPNEAGDLLTRSVVFFDRDGDSVLVGAAAIDQMLRRPEDVVYSLKRFMGRTGHDHGVSDERRQVTYSIEETERHKLVVHVAEQRLTPPEIAAQVLRRLRLDAERSLGRPVRRAVITVPAYFKEPQRQATHEAGRLAGLEVPRIINEPTGAALAFGLGAEPQTVAVYDLGGGTFDISILRIDTGLSRVLATDGDAQLGGDDIDRAIVGWIRDRIADRHRVSLPEDDMRLAARRIRRR